MAVLPDYEVLELMLFRSIPRGDVKPLAKQLIARFGSFAGVLGATVEEGPDYIRVTPPDDIRAATIDTYDDHRMAMCFSLASLDGKARRGNAIRINDPKCVAKTFPEYFEAFAGIATKELF